MTCIVKNVKYFKIEIEEAIKREKYLPCSPTD